LSNWTNLWQSLGWGTSKRHHGVQVVEPSSGRLTTRTVNADTAMQISSVFASVRLLSETIASLPLEFYEKKSNGSFVLISEHPLQTLLTTKPNKYQTSVEFFETLMFQFSLHGNAYHRIDRNKSKDIISLIPYMTPQTQTVLDRVGNVIYKYQDGNGTAFIADDNMWHNRLFGNGVVGMSPLDYARNSIGIAIGAEDRASKIANNGFRPAGVLMIDKILKAEQRKQIREQFSDLVDGGNDALRVLEAGMKYEQVSMSPKDVQFLESRRFQTEDIARFFNVPSVMINDTSASTVWGSGIEQIMRGFYRLGLRPYLEKLEASIRVNLLKVEERHKIFPRFNFDLLLRGDEETRYKIYEKAIKYHIRPPNECRAAEGLGPLEGGDEFPVIKMPVFQEREEDEK